MIKIKFHRFCIGIHNRWLLCSMANLPIIILAFFAKDIYYDDKVFTEEDYVREDENIAGKEYDLTILNLGIKFFWFRNRMYNKMISH